MKYQYPFQIAVKNLSGPTEFCSPESLKLREMLQRLTECVYQRKAKTAEHLNLYKVYSTSVVYLGITNT